MDTDSKNLNLEAKLEALLFSYGEAIEIKKIAKILETDELEIKKLGDILRVEYEKENRGIVLLQNEDKLQLATKSEFYPTLEKLVKEEFKSELSPASLETLSLVSYLGPISKAEIEYYRGVNCSFILRSLLMRGLVEKFSNPQRPTSSLYRPSFDLLKHLGISKIEDLPEFENYKKVLLEKKLDEEIIPMTDNL